MQRVVLIKLNSLDFEFIKQVNKRYLNHKKIWILPARDYKTDSMNGLILYSHPWSVKKFTYLILSYVVYMWNLGFSFIICTQDMFDFVLLQLVKKSVVFYNNVEWKSPKRMIEKNITYPILKKADMMFKKMPLVLRGQCIFGMFPYEDDDKMLRYWGNDRIIKCTNSIVKYVEMGL